MQLSILTHFKITTCIRVLTSPLHHLMTSLMLKLLLQLCIFSELETSYSSVCPLPSPCLCKGNTFILCSFIRMKNIPYMTAFRRKYTELDLSENFLQSLPHTGLKGVRVVRLNLSRNTIDTVDVDAFVGVISVDELDLSHNYLRDLPLGVFTPIPDLRVLRMRYNQFISISYGTFAKLTRLEVLDLTGNNLRRIPTQALRQLEALKTLRLRNNALARIEPFAFNKCH